MATTTELIESTGVQVCTEQDFDLEIPVLAGLQRQGDVLVRPSKTKATTLVEKGGTPVVRGENGGNTHTIYPADGPVFCDVQAGSNTELLVAILSVPEGSTAYLGHPEHGYMGIAPGDYTIGRQREMAEEIRRVAD